jgi:hypothetical protein
MECRQWRGGFWGYKAGRSNRFESGIELFAEMSKSSINAARFTQMVQAGVRRGDEDSNAARASREKGLPERKNQARCWVCQESFHEESHGIGPAPIMCRTPAASVKAIRRIPAFPHNGQHVAPQGGSRTLCS